MTAALAALTVTGGLWLIAWAVRASLAEPRRPSTPEETPCASSPSSLLA